MDNGPAFIELFWNPLLFFYGSWNKVRFAKENCRASSYFSQEDISAKLSSIVSHQKKAQRLTPIARGYGFIVTVGYGFEIKNIFQYVGESINQNEPKKLNSLTLAWMQIRAITVKVKANDFL